MKKIFLFSLVAIALSVQLFAQTIPNAGFENWSGGNPVSWATTNTITIGASAGPNVTKDSTDVHGGKYAVKLETINVIVLPVAAAMVAGSETINGTTVTPSGGFPYTTRAQTFSGYYEYTPGTGDSCLMQAWLFKRNGGSRDTIASVTFKSPNTVSTYSLFSADFVYHTGAVGNETPDSALVLICSSHVLSISGPKTGSTLLVDDIAFSGSVPTGVKQVSQANFNVSLFPNPASNELNFKFNTNNVSKLNVFDVLGKKVKTFNLSSSNFAFSVSDLNNGMYFYQLLDNQEAIITTGRFSVKK